MERDFKPLTAARMAMLRVNLAADRPIPFADMLALLNEVEQLRKNIAELERERRLQAPVAQKEA